MPYRRRRRTYRRRTRGTRRTSTRSYRRKWRRSRAAKSNSVMVKLRVGTTITGTTVGANVQYAIGGATTSAFASISVYNPWVPYNNTPGTADPALPRYSALYDLGKVCAIKLHYTPYSQASAESAVAFPPLWACLNPDDPLTQGTPIGYAQASDYAFPRQCDMAKPWKVYYKLRRFVGGYVDQTVAPPPVVVYPGGYYNTAGANTCPGFASIYLISDSNQMTSAITYGKLIITYYMKFKDRF